jgi:uncharacterized membrane protein
MSKKFFTIDEQTRIAEAIQKAENNTSGEIKVYVSTKAQSGDVVKGTALLFQKLSLDKTKYRNCVLIALATADRKVAIWGDKGIHELVPEDYWQSTLDMMRSDMKKGLIAEGIIQGIHQIGEKLKKYFPIEANDINELSNDVLFE